MRRRHKSKFDYYHELSVEETATSDEIKHAYRILAKRYHPDKSGDEARFKRISEAYEVLIDPKLRKQYDDYEHSAVRIAPKRGDINTDSTEKKVSQRSPFVDFIKTKDDVTGNKNPFANKGKNPFTKYQK